MTEVERSIAEGSNGHATANGRKKPGRKPYPRDAEGNIIRPGQKLDADGVVMDEGNGADEEVPTEAPKGKGRSQVGKTKVEPFDIPPLQLAEVIIPILGISELVVNNFSKKGRQEMLDKQMGKPRNKKAPKVPTDDFLGSLYVIGDKQPKLMQRDGFTYATGFIPGFPANAVKLAAVSACASIDGIYKTEARSAFHVLGHLLPILDPKTGKPAVPVMRDDVVRLAGPRPVADIRFRACFKEWRIDVPVRYNTRVINPTKIAHLLNTAGFGVGIGEWRPERDGNFGMFQVDL